MIGVTAAGRGAKLIQVVGRARHRTAIPVDVRDVITGTFVTRAICDADIRQFVNAKESAPM